MTHDGVTFAPYRADEPDRLPGESRSAYKRRTVPGYAEKQRIKRERQDSRPRTDSDAMGTIENPLPPMAPYVPHGKRKN